jgi:pimeloyl-ACP methyl ester carboxylesterase
MIMVHAHAIAPRHVETTAARPNYITTADGTELFYRDWGRGRPLLFLSGWTLNSAMWGYQMHPLAAQGFRCVAYDRRGHGLSSDPGCGYDYDTLADDLAALIEALDLRDVVVVAHSFSSAEIVRYLTRHGDKRISGVLMLAPAAIPFLIKTDDNPSGIPSEWLLANETELKDDFSGWAERRSQAYFAHQGSRGVTDATLSMMNQATYQAAIELADIQATTDFRPELVGIKTPMLFIHGDADASIPLEVTSKPACDLFENARLVIYKDAPHGLYFTHKVQLNRDIADFASSVQRA